MNPVFPRPVRCLLVYPKFSNYSFWNYSEACEFAGHRYPTSPLGLMTVAALLPRDWECRLIDLNARRLDEAALDWADIVMTGGMITQQLETLRLIRLAHAQGKPVAVGGPDPTSQPEIYKEAEYRVLDEGEVTIPAFIRAFRAGLPSGVFRSQGVKPELAATPIPRFDLVNLNDYAYIGLQTSRGCPYNCEFCDIIELYGRVPRTKPPERLIAELEALRDAGWRGHVDFVDDNFIGNKKAAKILLRELWAWSERNGWPFYFSTEVTITLAQDEELLEWMRRCDFRHVFIGIETPDERALRATRKAQNVLEPAARSVRRIHEAGMMVLAGFITGFDEEPEDAAGVIARFIEESGICVAMFGLLTSLPNTGLDRRLALENRLLSRMGGTVLRPEDIDQTSSGLNFLTRRPRERILSEYREAILRLYSPQAYFDRLGKFLGELRPAWRHRPCARRSFVYAAAFLRVTLALARTPSIFVRYALALARALPRGRQAFAQAVALSAMYVHFRRQAAYIADRIGADLRALSEDGEPAYLRARGLRLQRAASDIDETSRPLIH